MATSKLHEYAKLLLEPVNLPLETDSSLLLSAVQSSIPGAHGIYYRDENGSRIGLRYNAANGRISPPPFGWNDQPVYVHISHGCGQHRASNISTYETATQQFSKSVEMVHKMLAASMTGKSASKYGHLVGLPTSTSSSSSRRLSKRSVVQDGFEAQSEHNSQLGEPGQQSPPPNGPDEPVPEKSVANIENNTSHSLVSVDQKDTTRVVNGGNNAVDNKSNANAQSAATTVAKEEEMKKVRFDGNQTNGAFEVQANGINAENEHPDGNQSIIQQLESQLAAKEEDLRNLAESKRALEEEIAKRDHQKEEETKNFSDTESRLQQLREENEEKQKTIQELYQRHSEALEQANNVTQQDEERKSKYEADMKRLEQRLNDAIQEKEFYKKEYMNENRNLFSTVVNGEKDKDDFGQELSNALKRKYQLEEKVKKLETEVYKAHEAEKSHDEKVKELEKHLWLKGEHIGRLEADLRLQHHDNEQLRRENDRLNSVISAEKGGEGVDVAERIATEVEEIRAQYEAKQKEAVEQKGKAEWRLGETTKLWNDAKWRVGELEAELGHKHWELQQAWDRIKQLESSHETPQNELHAELDRLKADVYRLADEKGKVEWTLGEVKQGWDNAKWRVGELEAEVAHKDHELEQARNRVAELENGSSDIGNLYRTIDELRQQKETAEWRLGEVTQWWNDSKWRLGEVEGELSHIKDELGQAREGIEKSQHDSPEHLLRQVNELREEKNNLEWRFGEVTQLWNDAKWRIGELEAEINRVNSERDYLDHHQTSNAPTSDEDKQSLWRIIDELKEEKSKVEWHFGEVKQWWNDALHKVEFLENELRHKEEYIRQLHDEAANRNSHVDHDQLHQIREEKSKIEWRLGEVVQYWNDAKWRIGELDEVVRQKDGQLRNAYGTIDHLKASSFSTDAISKLSECFLIRKQPYVNREKWDLVLWDTTVAKGIDLRRVWFEVPSNGSHNVFFIGSFANWECALRCERVNPADHHNLQCGVWVDLPPGRYEFRFIRDGEWYTADGYPTVDNDFGSRNNWRTVD